VKTVAVTLGAAIVFVAAGAAGWSVWSGQRRADASRPTIESTGDGTTPQSSADSDSSGAVPRFVDVTESAGIDFEYFRGESGQWWTMEPTAGGIAFVDFDGDGWLDTYWVSGCQLPDDDRDRDHPHRLYRNNQDGTFAEVTGSANLLAFGYGMGCQAGDYDEDGFPDLYVTRFGTNDLFHNNGDGTYSLLTESAGVASQPQWHSSTAFADLDRDGDLDLYVCTYVPFDGKTHEPCRRSGKPGAPQEYCGPQLYPLGLPDILYRNEGDGTFTDVGPDAGVAGDLPNSKGLGVVASDLDKDGWPDLYVANDLVHSFLFHNQGGMKFIDVAPQAGAATNAEGVDEASMGIACGDVDDNGYFDLLVTHFYLEHATFFKNLAPPTGLAFQDSTRVAGLALATRHRMGWGTTFDDYDLDGRLDLFIVNGHLNPAGMSLEDERYAMPAQLFRNDGRGRFKEVTENAGPFFQVRSVSRGAATGDYDNDGRFDIAVVHHHKKSVLVHNETTAPNHVIGLELVSRDSNRDAINARVTVRLPSTGGEPAHEFIREIFGGGTYVSALDRRLLIGLGASDRIDRLEVVWPNGHVETIDDLAADRQWLLVEGLPPREVRRYAPLSAPPQPTASSETGRTGSGESVATRAAVTPSAGAGEGTAHARTGR
jgi:hypothetical protein